MKPASLFLLLLPSIPHMFSADCIGGCDVQYEWSDQCCSFVRRLKKPEQCNSKWLYFAAEGSEVRPEPVVSDSTTTTTTTPIQVVVSSSKSQSQPQCTDSWSKVSRHDNAYKQQRRKGNNSKPLQIRGRGGRGNVIDECRHTASAREDIDYPDWCTSCYNDAIECHCLSCQDCGSDYCNCHRYPDDNQESDDDDDDDSLYDTDDDVWYYESDYDYYNYG